MNRIKELRKKQGKSLEEIAEALGVSHVTINRWEREENAPSKSDWEALATYFGVTPAYIVGWSDSEKIAISGSRKSKVFHPETNIGLLRMEHNLTMAEFTKKIGDKSTGATLVRIEIKGQAPSKNYAEKVAKAFNVNKAFVMGWTNNRDPHLLDDVEVQSE